MKRLQLFEFEDLPWVPAPVRDGGTDLLDLAFARLGFYDGLAGELRRLLDETGEREVVDVCSGGGGGALSLHARLRASGRDDVRLTLTDRYPNAAAAARVRALGDDAVRYLESPVDAFAVPGDLRGVRTMYGALHHFPPDAVARLLAGVVADRAPVALFDVAASPVVRRLPLALAPLLALPNLLALGVAALAVTPLVRPRRASRLALTYLLPVIPALFAWDGTVSALRAYTPDELLAIARAAPGGDGYAWRAATAGSALCLTGRPLGDAAS